MSPGSPLRYAILRHEGVPDPHFDLMFETAPGSPLATWRSSDWPVRRDSRLTVLPEHRTAYLTYEGPLSGGRGTVRRVATGWHSISDMRDSALVVMLDDGSILRLPRT